MSQSKTINTNFILNSTFSGGLAQIVTDFFFFPIDTIKTIKQAISKNQAKNLTKVRYSGIICNVAAAFPGGGSFFLVYDLYRSLYKFYFPDYSNLVFDSFMGSLFAEFFSSMLRNPFEIIKQNMQIQKFKTAREGFRQIMKLGGIKGFYRGWSILLIRDIPYSMVEMPIYESLKHNQLLIQYYPSKNKNDTNIPFYINLFQASINGAVAGAIAAAFTNPIDIIKTRKMTESFYDKPNGLIQILKKIKEEEGLIGFYRGGMARIIYLGCGGLLYFASYEIIKSNLAKISWLRY